MNHTIREKSLLKELRKKIFITGYKGGMAHLASCYSCLEMLYALYMKDVLRYDKDNPGWKERDRFILSKGHAGLALYSVLLTAGLITDAAFSSYLREKPLIGGEPCMRDCEWIEASTGSLGHGLSMGLGMAMALKQDGSHARVFVMLGDGEAQEGTVWEAAMMAAAMKLDNLVVILDNNRIQKMDYVAGIIGEPAWQDKWEAFGWQVVETDGHDMDGFARIAGMSGGSGRPVIIIAHTVKGKGVSIMENNPGWHFKLPGKKELKVFQAELGISDEELV